MRGREETRRKTTGGGEMRERERVCIDFYLRACLPWRGNAVGAREGLYGLLEDSDAIYIHKYIYVYTHDVRVLLSIGVSCEERLYHARDDARRNVVSRRIKRSVNERLTRRSRTDRYGDIRDDRRSLMRGEIRYST